MPNMKEILAMFSEFGFEEAAIRHQLAQGSSAFNAFEGLKLQLEDRWGVMCQETSAARQQELKPIYDRLQAITMKSRTTRADKQKVDRERLRRIAATVGRRMEERKVRNGELFFDAVRDRLRQAKRDGRLSPSAEARAKATGIFEEDEEI
jgi:hypothetical protein